MNDVADASNLSKATLYHYFADKGELLKTIADTHVSRLVEVVSEIEARNLAPEQKLRALVAGFMQEYETAHHSHRVLTGDVRFLAAEDRELILAKERRVVAAFSDAIGAVRPELKSSAIDKPCAMLLFGMINWMFTWLDAKGRLSYEDMSQLVTELFLRGFVDMPVLHPAKT